MILRLLLLLTFATTAAAQPETTWTHGAGSGKAIAELISGHQPEMNFRFYGY